MVREHQIIKAKGSASPCGMKLYTHTHTQTHSLLNYPNFKNTELDKMFVKYELGSFGNNKGVA